MASFLYVERLYVFVFISTFFFPWSDWYNTGASVCPAPSFWPALHAFFSCSSHVAFFRRLIPRVPRFPSLQKPFQPAFAQQQDAGLRYAILPRHIFPTGLQFFDHDYEENYLEIYHSEALVAHNNWIKGHDDKLERFREYHLWGVDETSFPSCS